jgi:P27 family predicted phage terminase small subunit
MRGRKPTPPETKVLRASRGDRLPAPGSGPVASDAGEPDAPPNLDDATRAEFDRLTTELRALGLLSRSDRATLALYCDAFARWNQARASIAARGLVVETPLGGIKTNPAAAIAAQAQGLMLRILAELGLTPTARARLVTPAVPADAMDDFLGSRSRKIDR